MQSFNSGLPLLMPTCR